VRYSGQWFKGGGGTIEECTARANHQTQNRIEHFKAMNSVIKIVGITFSFAAGAVCGAGFAYIVSYSLAHFDMCDITGPCGVIALPVVLLGALGGIFLGVKCFA
jgi:hypothetical protein